MTNNKAGKRIEALTPEELQEMDELLAQIDEKFNSMDAAEADGFMTAIELISSEKVGSDWMEEILAPGSKGGTTGNTQKDRRLRELLNRRRNEIRSTLQNAEPLDPVYFDVEDGTGKVLEGKDAIVALEPFAMGFLEAAQKWPDLLESESTQIAAALLGIFRHLPQDALGDLVTIKEDLDKKAPLNDLPEALSDLASCVAVIAQVSKGYDLPSLNEPVDDEKKARQDFT